MSNLPAVLVHICLGCEAQSECSSCGFIIESRVQSLKNKAVVMETWSNKKGVPAYLHLYEARSPTQLCHCPAIKKQGSVVTVASSCLIK